MAYPSNPSLITARPGHQPIWGIAAEKRKAEKALQAKAGVKAKAKGKAKPKAAVAPTWGNEDVPDEWPADDDLEGENDEELDGEELNSGDGGL